MSKYLVSRKEELGHYEQGSEMVRYNVWERMQWPIKEVKIGDIIYFFSTISRKIKLKTKVIGLDIEKIESKKELKEILTSHHAVWDEEYITKEKEENSYLFLYKVEIIKILDEDLDIELNQLGWKRWD